jgi:hypothetical protein
MKIGGVSIILILGLVNMGLLSLQLASGLRWVKLQPGMHRKSGIALFVTAMIHGILGIISQLS